VADLFEMTGRDDRRREPRTETHIRAWADPGGAASVVDCVVIDVSDEGARVASVAGVPLASSFTLQVDQENALGEATVMWRAANAVGVKFATQKADPGARNGQFASRPERLWDRFASRRTASAR
jgi:hypothetical protein